MMLFRNSIKQNFKTILDNANFIYKETLSCFQPVINAYWHFYYTNQMHYNNLVLSVTKEELQYSFNTFYVYIAQLIKIQSQLNQEYLKNEKYLLKFKLEMDKFNNWQNDLIYKSTSLINDIFKIKNYRDYDELNFIVKNLNILNKKIKNITQKTNNLENNS